MAALLKVYFLVYMSALCKQAIKRYKTFQRNSPGASYECCILNSFFNVKTMQSNTIDFYLFCLLKD